MPLSCHLTSPGTVATVSTFVAMVAVVPLVRHPTSGTTPLPSWWSSMILFLRWCGWPWRSCSLMESHDWPLNLPVQQRVSKFAHPERRLVEPSRYRHPACLLFGSSSFSGFPLSAGVWFPVTLLHSGIPGVTRPRCPQVGKA